MHFPSKTIWDSHQADHQSIDYRIRQNACIIHLTLIDTQECELPWRNKLKSENIHHNCIIKNSGSGKTAGAHNQFCTHSQPTRRDILLQIVNCFHTVLLWMCSSRHRNKKNYSIKSSVILVCFLSTCILEDKKPVYAISHWLFFIVIVWLVGLSFSVETKLI